MLSMLAAGVQTSLWGEALVVSTPLPAVSLSQPSSRGAKEDIAIDPRHTGILVEGMPTQGLLRSWEQSRQWSSAASATVDVLMHRPKEPLLSTLCQLLPACWSPLPVVCARLCCPESWESINDTKSLVGQVGVGMGRDLAT